MNKCIIFLFLVILAFPACDLQMPDAVEIKGSPELRVSANYNIGKLFSDNLDNMIDALENENLSVFHCSKTVNQTYVIYQELLSKTINLDSLDSGSLSASGVSQDFLDFLEAMGDNAAVPGYEYHIDNEATLLEGSINLPLTEISGLIEDFIFSEAKILLYISGRGGLVNLLTVDFSAGGENQTEDLNGSKPSGVASWKAANNVYTSPNAPDNSSLKIDLQDISLGSDIDINYKVYIEDGKTISPADLSNICDIKIEAVIWLPLVLKAGPSGAVIPMDDLFKEDEDLFGRESDDDLDLNEYIERLSLKIVLDNNPFQNAEINVKSQNLSGEVIIPILLTGNSINLEIDNELVNDINNHIPFSPVVSLKIPADNVLSIPRDFKLNVIQFALSAKMKYRHELASGGI